MQTVTLATPLDVRLQPCQKVQQGRLQEHIIARFIHAIVWVPPGTAPPTECSKFYESVLKLLGEAIDGAVARGELKPASTRVRLLALMGALSEAANGFVITGQPELTPELADALIDTIADGWSCQA